MTPNPADFGLTRHEGVLRLGGVDLTTVAQQYSTPCYVYDEQMISRSYRDYAGAAGRGGRICYAVKANPTHAILHQLARLGAGFDIVSGGEMRRVLDAGGTPASIVFSGVGKSDDEMRAALEAGIGCFNVESQSELLRLNQIAVDLKRVAPVALRVNPDVEAVTHRHIATGTERHKFGISQRSAASLAASSMHLPGISVIGLAMHIGSQIIDPTPIVAAARKLASMAGDLADAGLVIRHLDLGGGLGVGAAAPAIADYVRLLRSTIGERFEMILEPGRSIVAEAGLLLTRVVCIKHSNRRSFAVVDAGMNDFLRPALYDARHDIVSVDARRPAPTATYDVVGPVCESADTLGFARRLAIREHSLLAVLQAGAYGATMSSHYNSRPFCAEVFISDATARLARRPQTVADMVRNEVTD